MIFRRLATTLPFLAMVATLGLTACGEEDEEEQEEEPHEPMSQSCIDLSELCHEADTGSGPAHDCHEIAHADVEADCAAALVDCMTTCM
jgi:hypothetical protein